MGRGRYFDNPGQGKSTNKSSYDSSKSYNERRFESENKKASDRLRRSIQTLTVEEQIDRRGEIDDIAAGSGFQTRAFVSRNKQNIPEDIAEDMDLDSIPLPKNDKDWRENSGLILSKKVNVFSIFFSYFSKDFCFVSYRLRKIYPRTD